ncbi:MAG: HIT family protein [Candidatus Bathyarchaeia archaeon]|jgi:histidine triad (HIT) family protein
MNTACPFCSITQGKLPASIIYEDKNVLAFMDLNPVNTGHTLVASKNHYENIYETPENVLSEMVAVAKKISAAVKKTVNADGISIVQLNGKAAGQVVMHIHIHVIPKFSEDSTSKARIMRHQGEITQKREALDEIAQRIRENL